MKKVPSLQWTTPHRISLNFKQYTYLGVFKVIFKKVLMNRRTMHIPWMKEYIDDKYHTWMTNIFFFKLCISAYQGTSPPSLR